MSGRYPGYLLGSSFGGGQATVYQAVEIATDEMVAIKEFKGDAREHLARFQREAAQLERLGGEHVVRFLSAGTTPAPHIVMEWVDGGTLQDRLYSPEWDPSLAGPLFEDILAGLQVLHDHRVLHRDLKPSNVLLRARAGRPVACLADLGTAKQLAGAHVQPDTTLTGTNATIGSEGFQAPECRGQARQATLAADLYSLGCLLYALHRRGPPPYPLGDALLGLPERVARVCALCLSPNPQDRPASVDEVKMVWWNLWERSSGDTANAGDTCDF